MGFFKRKKTEERAEESGFIQLDRELLLDDENEVNCLNVRQISAIVAAIDKIALTVAKLPVKLYERSENGCKPKELTNDRRPFLLSVDCGDTLSISDFWQAMISDYYLCGGGWAFINRDLDGVRSLHYVDSDNISVARNNDPIFKDYDVFVNGKRYYPFDFIKILRHTKNGSESNSVVKENSQLLSAAYKTLKFEREQINRGGNKRGFFKSAHKLNGEALKELKEAVQELYSKNKSALLNDGVDFKETSATSMELQLNESKKAHGDEIFNIFGFPSAVICGGATESDIAQFNECIVNLLNVIESALDKDLLAEFEKKSLYFAFDTRELTRGKLKERYEAYEIGLRNHFMQIDEVRKEEDREPYGFNYMSLSLADVLIDPETKEVFVPNTGQNAKLGEKVFNHSGTVGTPAKGGEKK